RFADRHSPSICSTVGQTIFVKGIPLTVIGVLPKRFLGIEATPVDVWIPLQVRPELNAWGIRRKNYYADPKWWCIKLLARLVPGVSQARAETMVHPAFQHAAYEYLGGQPRQGERPRRLSLLPARGIGESQGAFEQPLYIVLAMVGLILLIACGN